MLLAGTELVIEQAVDDRMRGMLITGGLADATLKEHGQDALTAEHRGRLNRIGPVSAGDYRIAIRRAEIEGIPLAAPFPRTIR